MDVLVASRRTCSPLEAGSRKRPANSLTINPALRWQEHMSDFKGIPLVTTPARSGEKYLTPQGTTAIKDGIKAGASAAPLPAGRKPAWLRAPMPGGQRFDDVRQTVREHRLATVCEEAKCPNIGECWNAGTATLMLMGEVCTRACRFCAVDTGNPRGWLDADGACECGSNRAADAAGLRGADLCQP